MSGMGEAHEISALGTEAASWKEAFRKQDGYGLLTLLRGKPYLLFVKHGGCNVLHLAIRNRWYGLVREVLLNFCQLRTDVSEDDSEPTQYFSQEQFWCLLKEKESGAEFSSTDDDSSDLSEDEKFKYASDLDVLAMAVVQSHGAINTILAEAAQTVGGGPLYDGGEVIRWKAGQTAEGSNTYRTMSEYSRTLTGIIAECFTCESRESSDRETENERAHAAPTVSPAATGSQGTAGGSGPNLLQQPLEDKIDPAWKKEWKVTSPFLPFEEFFFLACCFPPVAWRGSSSTFHKVSSQVLRSCGREAYKFCEYLADISDTWGTAIHHAVHAEETSTTSQGALSLLLEIASMLFGWIEVNKRDTAGRTPLYTQLALKKSVKSFVELEGVWIRFVDASKDTKNYGRWSFGKGECEIDVKAVSGRNGYSPHEPFNEGEILGFHSILRSPHLAESKRIGWMTKMMFAAYKGDGEAVQYMARMEYYDAARLQKLREPAEYHDRGVLPKLLNCSALHVAAAAGHPHVIRAILSTGKFDPLLRTGRVILLCTSPPTSNLRSTFHIL